MSAARPDLDRREEAVAADGHRLACDVFDPPTPPRATIVVLQEIFGVNGHIRRVASGFRDLGYRAIAPAMFDRRERGVELPYDDAGIAAGMAIVKSLRWSEAAKDVAAAMELATGPVGVVGYCWGGTVAWVAASRVPQLRAAVAYYGGFIPRLLDQRPACPVMLHWAEHDHVVSRADREAAMAAYPEIPQHTYDAEHGFNCDERSAYEPAAATLALERTLSFLSHHLAAVAA